MAAVSGKPVGNDVHWSGHKCIGQCVSSTGWKSGLNI